MKNQNIIPNTAVLYIKFEADWTKTNKWINKTYYVCIQCKRVAFKTEKTPLNILISRSCFPQRISL